MAIPIAKKPGSEERRRRFRFEIPAEKSSGQAGCGGLSSNHVVPFFKVNNAATATRCSLGPSSAFFFASSHREEGLTGAKRNNVSSCPVALLGRGLFNLSLVTFVECRLTLGQRFGAGLHLGCARLVVELSAVTVCCSAVRSRRFGKHRTEESGN